MAKQTIVQLTDDIDGGDADESVPFAFRGVEYEIDLSSKNVAAFEKALSKYIDASRRVPRSRTRAVGRAGRSSGAEDLGAIREWARENGYEVADRGRIPAEIKEAYFAAR